MGKLLHLGKLRTSRVALRDHVDGGVDAVIGGGRPCRAAAAPAAATSSTASTISRASQPASRPILSAQPTPFSEEAVGAGRWAGGACVSVCGVWRGAGSARPLLTALPDASSHGAILRLSVALPWFRIANRPWGLSREGRGFSVHADGAGRVGRARGTCSRTISGRPPALGLGATAPGAGWASAELAAAALRAPARSA